MFVTNFPRTLLLAVFIISMSTILIQFSMDEEDVVTEALPNGSHTPEWFGHNVMSIKMNKQGLPEYQVWAQTLTHYADNNITDLIKPRFKQFPQTNSDDLWSLESDKGRIYHDEKLEDILRLDLWQNVHLSRPKKNGQTPLDMTTSTIAIFPKQSFAKTDQQVVLKQTGHVLQGRGMELYFDTEEFKLLNDVRSTHVTE